MIVVLKHEDMFINGFLDTDKIMTATNEWVPKVQQNDQLNDQPKRDTGMLKCEGRVKDYQPICLGGEHSLVNKLTTHGHNQVKHLCVNTARSVVVSTIASESGESDQKVQRQQVIIGENVFTVTGAASRAVHLKITKDLTAEGIQETALDNIGQRANFERYT